MNTITTGLNRSNRNYDSKRNVSFQASLYATRGAKADLKHNLYNFYRECGPEARTQFFGTAKFNFKKIFTRFKKAVEEATKDIQGTIKISRNPNTNTLLEFLLNNKPSPKISFVDKSKRELSHNLMTLNITDVVPDFEKKKPLSDATTGIVARISDTMANDGGLGYTDKNPFHLLFRKLIHSK